jgi:hypothetical protein
MSRSRADLVIHFSPLLETAPPSATFGVWRLRNTKAASGAGGFGKIAGSRA